MLVLKTSAPRWGVVSKYEDVFRGIEGIATAWILSRVFGHSSVVYSGIIFYCCTFLTTSAFEAAFTGAQKALFGRSVVDNVMSELPHSWIDIIRYLRVSKDSVPLIVFLAIWPFVVWCIAIGPNPDCKHKLTAT
jgi:hypothetical protein